MSHAVRNRATRRRRLLTARRQRALLNSVISAAGVRIGDSLTVEVPLTHVLDGLCRQESFFKELQERGRDMIRAASYLKPSPGHKLPQGASETLRHIERERAKAEALLQACRSSPSRDLPILEFARCAGRIVSHGRSQVVAPDGAEGPLAGGIDAFNSSLRHLWWTAIQLREFLTGPPSLAAAAQSLVVTGEAGIGKTHSFVDYAKDRLDQGRPTLILGARALSDEPIHSALAAAVGLQRGSAAELLRALNSSGAAAGQRALLLIDAINEASNPRAWRRDLPGLLRLARGFPHVAVVVSCRSSYMRLALPRLTGTRRVPYFEHKGFADREHEAALRFFAHYNIDAPITPVLAPEFSNPLFLEWFCRAHRNKRSRRPLVGHVGLTHTLEQFVKAIGRLLAQRHAYSDPAFLWRLLKALAEDLAAAPAGYLPVSNAMARVQERARAGGARGNVYASMLEYGLLAEDVRYTGNPPRPTVITRFTYQRFSDHLRVRYLLNAHLRREQPENTFATGAVLGELLRQPHGLLLHSGLVEALAIQVPERVGRELFELLPEQLEPELLTPTLQSLIWRSSAAWPTNRRLHDFILRHVRTRGTADDFLDTLLTLAGVPDHPFGAAALHRILMGKKVPTRDVLWSIYLHGRFGATSPLDRLLTWSTSEPAVQCDAVSAFGLATALAWCTTSSNRFIRDRATRGLVQLLGAHPGILRPLLVRFRGVDDPYVVERILAAVAGAIHHVHTLDALAAIAKASVDFVPRSTPASRNLLVRDYLQTIIDSMTRRGVSLPSAMRSAAAPRGRSWRPTAPAESMLNARYPDEGYGKIKWSVMSMGDFQRYILDGPVESFVPRTVFGQRVQGSPWQSTLLRDFMRQGRPALVRAARRWVFVRTIRWGWNPQRFGEFDRQMTWADTRQAHKAERVGKKYQWLAFHELLGRLSDGMLFAGRYGQVPAHRVDRAREIGVRDFDPTIPAWLLACRSSAEGRAWYVAARTPLRPMAPVDQQKWVRSRRSFPDPRAFRAATNPATRTSFTLLDGFIEWLEPAPPEEERFEHPRRRMFLSIRSFLIDNRDVPAAEAFIADRRVFEVNLANHDTLHHTFLAETTLRQEEHEEPNQKSPQWAGSFELPPTALDYIWEGTSYDGSLRETLRLAVPSPDLAQLLSVRWKAPSARWQDEDDVPVCWDPGPESGGPSVLLVNTDLLVHRLAEERKALLWTAFGEKMILDSAAIGRTYPLPQSFMGATFVAGRGWQDGPLRSRFL